MEQEHVTGRSSNVEAGLGKSILSDQPVVIEVPDSLKAQMPDIRSRLEKITGELADRSVQGELKETLMGIPAWREWIERHNAPVGVKPVLVKAGLGIEGDDAFAHRILVGLALSLQPGSYVPPYSIDNQAVTEVVAKAGASAESHSENDRPAPPHTAGFFEDTPPHTCYFACVRPHLGGGAETTVVNIEKILGLAPQALIDDWQDKTHQLKTSRRLGSQIRPFNLLSWKDGKPFFRYRKEYTVDFESDPSLKLLEELITNPKNHYVVPLKAGEILIHWNGAPHSRLPQKGMTPEAESARRKLIRCRSMPESGWETVQANVPHSDSLDRALIGSGNLSRSALPDMDVERRYPTVVQFEILRQLLQCQDFQRECAVAAHQAYMVEVVGMAPKDAPTLAEEAADKNAYDRAVAQSLTPLYAIEGSVAELWRREKRNPIDSLRGYLLSEDSPLGLRLDQIFANSTRKAGQPFGDMDRIRKNNFVPSVFLSQEEINKDHVLTQAVGKLLLRRLQSELSSAYPEAEELELFGRIEKVLEHATKNAKNTGKELMPGQIVAMRKTARETMYAHRNQRRKSGLPYFHHQLDVVDTLLSEFKVRDPRLTHIAFRHDSREDQPLHYEHQKTYRLNKLSRNESTPGADRDDLKQKRLNLWHEALAIRMLSNLEGPKYDHLQPEERLQEYYKRLCDPRKYYDNPLRPPYNDEWIRGVQLVKLADILSNLADLSTLLKPQEGHVQDKNNALFAIKFVNKILTHAVPGLVTQSRYLSTEDRRKFFNAAEVILRGYITENPTVFEKPFINALTETGGFIDRLVASKRLQN